MFEYPFARYEPDERLAKIMRALEADSSADYSLNPAESGDDSIRVLVIRNCNDEIAKQIQDWIQFREASDAQDKRDWFIEQRRRERLV